MFGVICGDVVGSAYKYVNVRDGEFPFLTEGSRYTLNTVMSVAVAETLMQVKEPFDNQERYEKTLVQNLRMYGQDPKYVHACTAGRFGYWLSGGTDDPLEADHNVTAVCAAPLGWCFKDFITTASVAGLTANVTHRHAENVKGARVAAGAVCLARLYRDKRAIRDLAGRNYDLDAVSASLCGTRRFDPSCAGTVPVAIMAFLRADSFEEAIRNAVLMGGDSAAVTAITGAVAEAYFGLDVNRYSDVSARLDNLLRSVSDEFMRRYTNGITRDVA